MDQMCHCRSQGQNEGVLNWCQRKILYLNSSLLTECIFHAQSSVKTLINPHRMSVDHYLHLHFSDRKESLKNLHILQEEEFCLLPHAEVSSPYCHLMTVLYMWENSTGALKYKWNRRFSSSPQCLIVNKQTNKQKKAQKFISARQNQGNVWYEVEVNCVEKHCFLL